MLKLLVIFCFLAAGASVCGIVCAVLLYRKREMSAWGAVTMAGLCGLTAVGGILLGLCLGFWLTPWPVT